MGHPRPPPALTAPPPPRPLPLEDSEALALEDSEAPALEDSEAPALEDSVAPAQLAETTASPKPPPAGQSMRTCAAPGRSPSAPLSRTT